MEMEPRDIALGVIGVMCLISLILNIIILSDQKQ